MHYHDSNRIASRRQGHDTKPALQLSQYLGRRLLPLRCTKRYQHRVLKMESGEDWSAEKQPPEVLLLQSVQRAWDALLQGMYGSIRECVQPPPPLGSGPRSGRRAAGLAPAYYVVRMLGLAGRARSCLPGDLVPVLLPVNVALLSGYSACWRACLWIQPVCNRPIVLFARHVRNLCGKVLRFIML